MLGLVGILLSVCAEQHLLFLFASSTLLTRRRRRKRKLLGKQTRVLRSIVSKLSTRATYNGTGFVHQGYSARLRWYLRRLLRLLGLDQEPQSLWRLGFEILQFLLVTLAHDFFWGEFLIARALVRMSDLNFVAGLFGFRKFRRCCALGVSCCVYGGKKKLSMDELGIMQILGGMAEVIVIVDSIEGTWSSLVCHALKFSGFVISVEFSDWDCV